mmetsp:Transcript_20958/g.34618  ORF Transcript_20958/g.34618 Transcript_20958/m.34618 type:complete len:204 (-) Transcript_20958:280-891(-)
MVCAHRSGAWSAAYLARGVAQGTMRCYCHKNIANGNSRQRADSSRRSCQLHDVRHRDHSSSTRLDALGICNRLLRGDTQDDNTHCVGSQPSAGFLLDAHLRSMGDVRPPEQPVPWMVGRHVACLSSGRFWRHPGGYGYQVCRRPGKESLNRVVCRHHYRCKSHALQRADDNRNHYRVACGHHKWIQLSECSLRCGWQVLVPST